MARSMKRRSADVIYEINAHCLDLIELSGFFSKFRKKKLFESVMMGISNSALDMFDIDTFCFGLCDNHFHILLWTSRDDNRMARAMHFVRERFAEGVNRSLRRNGPVWDGRWSCQVRRPPSD